MPSHGDLTGWATQGVLLLNAALTVQEGSPGSRRKGWEKFTDAIIRAVNEKPEPVVFLLWGRDAREKGARCWKHRTHRRFPPVTASSVAGISKKPTAT